MQVKETALQVRRLGMQSYASAWQLQQDLAAAIAAGQQPPTLLLLQHPHTYTLGRSGDQANVLWSAADRARHEVSLFQVDRGGDATYHGPGQLVGYPLLPLGRLDTSGRLPQADYVGYLRQLEQVVIKALGGFGLRALRRAGFTGVWISTQPAQSGPNAEEDGWRKIASIGVKVDVNGISRHGFAINIDPDMSYWDGIVACGIAGAEMTALAQLMSPVPTVEQVEMTVIEAFSSVFETQVDVVA